MSPEQLMLRANFYLAQAAEAVDPQKHKLWLDLARECRRIAADAPTVVDCQDDDSAVEKARQFLTAGP